jgi:Rrf2 family protein
MDLTLTRRGDYVLRAAVDLAAAWRRDGGYRKLRELAEEMAIPRSYAPHILALLVKAGIAQALAGPQGGYRLRRPPTDVSVLEVIEAAEGTLGLDRCPMRGGPCRWDDVCAFHPTWASATDALRASLAQTDLDRVAADDARLASGIILAAPPAGHRRRTLPGR